ncbi:hypothetical protein F4808DRAFT_440362 [Astrocystis sublimbata]|nr:hypothetical protein F4808DRAFT_440362 [Astrocystis sublimbata]
MGIGGGGLIQISRNCSLWPHALVCVRVQISYVRRAYPHGMLTFLLSLLTESHIHPSQNRSTSMADSRPRAPSPEQPGLEVARHGPGTIASIQNDKEAIPIDYKGLHTIPGDEKYLHTPLIRSTSIEDGIQVAPGDVEGLHPVQNEEQYVPPVEPGDNNSVPREWTKKKILLVAGIVSLVVLAAVIVGAVLGTRKQHSPTHSPTPTDESQTAEMTGSNISEPPYPAPTAVVARNRLEIYALTKNESYSIYRKYQDRNRDNFEPSGMDMELVGGTVLRDQTASIALHIHLQGNEYRTEVIINAKGRLRTKFHDEDQALVYASPDDWFDFPITNLAVTGTPSEVKYNPDIQNMTVFYLAENDNNDLAVYYNTYQPVNSWRNKQQVPGNAKLSNMTPSVVAWNGDSTRLDLFVVGSENNHLLHASYDSGANRWTDYEDLGGFMATPPVAVASHAGIIDVFALGGDNRLWRLHYNNDDSTKLPQWELIHQNTKIQGRPHAVVDSSGILNVFAWGYDNKSILHDWYDGGWHNDFTVLGQSQFRSPQRPWMMEVRFTYSRTTITTNLYK